MKKFLRRLIFVTAALLVLALLAVLCRDPFLKLAAQQAIRDSTGLRAEIAGFKTGLGRPCIAMRGFKLHNYPEFGDSLLADIPDLLVEFDQQLAAQGKLRFKQLRLHLAELNVIHDAAGRWNLEKIEKEMTERNAVRVARGKPKLEFAGIEEMHLTIGRVTFRDLLKPLKSREILVDMRDERVADLQTEEALEEWIGSFIFKVILQEAVSPTAKRKAKPVEALKEALEK
jgi:hypothetical protein